MEEKERYKPAQELLGAIETLLNDVLGCPKGTQALKGILNRHGGADMYIPTETDLYKAWRNLQIRAQFKGDNHAELAELWKLKERQVRRIIHDEKLFIDIRDTFVD